MPRSLATGALVGALALVSIFAATPAPNAAAAPATPAPASTTPPLPPAPTGVEACLLNSSIISADEHITPATEPGLALGYALSTLQFELLMSDPDGLSGVTTIVDDAGLATGLNAHGSLSADAAATHIASVIDSLPNSSRDLVNASQVGYAQTNLPSFRSLCEGMEYGLEMFEAGAPVDSITIDLGAAVTRIDMQQGEAAPAARLAPGLANAIQFGESSYTPSEATSRSWDINGYNAGTAIQVGGTACTAAFMMRASGSPFLLTAGHCGQNNAQVLNGNNRCSPGSSLVNIGNLGSNLSGSSYDVAAVWPSPGTGLDPHIWQGAPCDEHASQFEVLTWGWGTPTYGSGIGFSGAVTGTAWGYVASQSASCIQHTFGGSTFMACGAWRAISAAGGGPLCQPGDSGGPAFTAANYGTGYRYYAAGSISGTFTMTQNGQIYQGCNYTHISNPIRLYGATLSSS